MTNTAGAPGPHTIDCTGINGVIALSAVLPNTNTTVTVNGPGAANLTITRGPFAAANDITGTLFDLVPSTGAWLTLNGLTISHPVHLEWRVMHVREGCEGTLNNCELYRTGGIENNSTLSLTDCIGNFNSGLSAGVILQRGVEGQVVTCTRCRFEQNFVHAASVGTIDEAGVLEERTGSAYIYDCTVLANLARDGAGAIRAEGHLVVRDSLFADNATNLGATARGGGAVRLESGAKEWTFERTWFRENRSYNGGALAVGYQGYTPSDDLPARVHECCFSGNTATNDGGAVFAPFIDAGGVVLYNSTVSGNTAGNVGGGLTGGAGAIEMDHCTVTLNMAGVHSGGCWQCIALATVVAGNSAPVCADTSQVASGRGGFGFYGIRDLALYPFSGSHTDVWGTPASPLDPMLGPLQLNGGATPTHLPLPGSPLIDRGSSGGHPYSNSFNHRKADFLADQRGLPRVVDQGGLVNVAGGDGSDIGAVEVQVPWVLESHPRLVLATESHLVASTAARLVVSAAALGTVLVVRADAPFEVSRAAAGGYASTAISDLPGAGGALPMTEFFVRYRPRSGLNHEGTLYISTPGGPSQVLLLSGRIDGHTQGGRVHFLDEQVCFQVGAMISTGYSLVPDLPRTTHVSGHGLSSAIQVSVQFPFQVALAPSGPWGLSVATTAPVAGSVPPTQIFVRMYPGQPGYYTCPLLGTAGGAPQAACLVRGIFELSLFDVFIPVVPNQWPWGFGPVFYLDFSATALNEPSAAQGVCTLAYSHYGFTGPITIAATGPFQISKYADTGWGLEVTTDPPTPAIPLTPLYVRYNPTAGTAHRGKLRLSSPGKMTFELPLHGIVNPPAVIHTSVQSIEFLEGQPNPPDVASYTVSGVGLHGPVTIAAPAAYGNGGNSLPFQLSFSQSGPWSWWLTTPQPVSGVLPPTTVFVSFQPGASLPPLTLNETLGGFLAHGSPGAASVHLPLMGPCVQAGIRPEIRNMQFKTGLGGPSLSQKYLLHGVSANAVTVNAPPHFEVALAAAGPWGPSVATPPPVGGIVQPIWIQVRYNPQGGGGHTGLLQHVSPGCLTANVELAGETGLGVIITSATSLCMTAPQVGQPSSTLSYSVSGYGLLNPVQVVAGAGFEVSLSATSGFGPLVVTAAPVGGYIGPQVIYVRYNPATGNWHGGAIAHSSAGAASQEITLTGMVPRRYAALDVTGMQFTTPAPGIPSAEQTYVATGVDVTAPMTVTAPAGFEVSLSSGTGFGASVFSGAPLDGIAGPLTIYVRYFPASGTGHAGTIEHTSAGENLGSLAVTGIVLLPSIQVSISSRQFATPAIGQPSAAQSYTVSGLHLAQPVFLSAPASFEISLSAAGPFVSQLQSGPPIAGVVSPFDVFVRYHPVSGVSHSGDVTHASAGATTIVVAVSGDVLPPPQMNISGGSLNLVSTGIGVPSPEQAYFVSGSFLLEKIIITTTPPFEVSLSSGAGFGLQVVTPAPTGGVLAPTQIFVRYLPLTQGPHAGTISHDTLALPTAAVSLDGRVVSVPAPSPLITVLANSFDFETSPGTPSAEKSYTVQGSALAGAITITASTFFEVSLTSGAGFGPAVATSAPAAGIVPATTIYVRYNPVSGMDHNGLIAHSCVGAATISLPLHGNVTVPPAPPAEAEASCSMTPARKPAWLLPAAVCLLILRRYRRTIHSAMLK